MRVSDWRQRLRTVLGTRFLRNILLVSVCIAVVFPIVDRFFLDPGFLDVVIEKAEDEAIRVAGHLALDLSVGPQGVTKESIPSSFIQEADEILRNLGLMKFNVFSRSGETLFSTTPEDIGFIHTAPRFHNIVAKGIVFTKITRKDTKALEGKLVTRHVVETYVPISDDGRFAGAIEIYYDVTDTITKIDRALAVSSTTCRKIARHLDLTV